MSWSSVAFSLGALASSVTDAGDTERFSSSTTSFAEALVGDSRENFSRAAAAFVKAVRRDATRQGAATRTFLLGVGPGVVARATRTGEVAREEDMMLGGEEEVGDMTKSEVVVGSKETRMGEAVLNKNCPLCHITVNTRACDRVR